MHILVTGAAGFIGSNLILRLLQDEPRVSIVGIDNMNGYYDIALKEFRLQEIEKSLAVRKADSTKDAADWRFVKGNIADKELVSKLFASFQPDIVVNLAAQAGVRYSITNPDAYIESNLIGFHNILEACRHSYDNGAMGVRHLV